MKDICLTDLWRLSVNSSLLAGLKIRLNKLERGERLRTDSVEGRLLRAVEVNRQLMMVSPPLSTGNIRWVNTSNVKKIKTTDTGWEIETENSKYLIELISEE